ncbi:MAG TPA: SDR family NAD(P)-dependent oxidoreductase [Lacisediminihabitans sp.]|uniref:SDR family NAD(P)-dependent oxidoreductase n=1 Tax=Lacisediminihabitans sp. TaxID=2787631 RepID=UPI002ED858F6
MTITLITGANKGLGFEAARRLIDAGHTVYLGSRDAEKGAEAAAALGAGPVRLDVTDDASVADALAEIGRLEGRIDVLVNNAGIIGPQVAVAELTAGDVRRTFETNVFGIVRTIHAALPLLRASENPVVVNVASGLGFPRFVTDPSRVESRFPTPAYGSSKAAVIMLSLQYAKSLPGIRINAVDPGYTATDLNGNSGTQSVEEGTDAIVRLATIGADGPTGTFQDRDGLIDY